MDPPLLHDHVVVSTTLYRSILRNTRIEHDVFGAELDRTTGDRDAHPSNHRPQSATFELGRGLAMR